jgi:hypothetical protein
MTPSEGTRQRLTVRSSGERVAQGVPTERFSPALCSTHCDPGATAPGCSLRAPGIAPEAPLAWAGAVYKIPIAEAAGLVVPSNVLRIVWREAATQLGVELSGLGQPWSLNNGVRG